MNTVVYFIPRPPALDTAAIVHRVMAELRRSFSMPPADPIQRITEAVKCRVLADFHPARETTATHEAGHAVVALALGVPVWQTNIDRRPDQWGAAMHGRVKNPIHDIAIATAGPLAVAMAMNEPPKLPVHEGSDMALAKARAAKCADPAKALADGFALAGRLLVKHWRAVEVIGRELSERGKLYRDQLESIYKASCDEH